MPELLWALLAGGLVLLLPGAALLVWLPRRAADWLENLADAVGLSLSLSALIALAAFLLDARFSPLALVGVYGFCLLALALGALLRLPAGASRPTLRGLAGVLPGAAGLAGALWWRWHQASGLLVPAWVDSLQHTLIVSKIVAHGGIPATLAPLMEVDLSYHYGFHLAAALFAFFAGWSAPDAVLAFGQAVNALIALAVYRLAKGWWGDWKRAALAALLVAFAFQMPAYYVTWGRYTLSAGLVLLPLAMFALQRAAHPQADWSDRLRALLLSAGLALTHLTGLLLLAFWAILLGLEWLRAALRKPGEAAAPGGVSARAGWRALLASLAGVLLASPWLWRIWQLWGAQAQVTVVSPLDGGQAAYWDYILYLLGPRYSHILLIAAGCGLILALLQRSPRRLALWGALIALLMLPWGLRLSPIRPDHMAIVLFLPAALLLANLLISGMERAARLPRPALRVGLAGFFALAGVFLVVWGGLNSRDVINRETVLVNRADMDALDWVRANTPAEAVFLINTTQWMSGVYRGVDGGYWLAQLTGRITPLPPILYVKGSKEFARQINARAEQASRLTTCDEPFWALVEDTGAGYVYLREGRGSLQPDGLLNCDRLNPVYRRGGVYIFQITR
ncbi:MAG: hypothetical protein AB1453_03975 [Chloroflexota bacterium]